MQFHDILIHPLMKILGIDDKSKEKIERSWKTVGDFFKFKIEEVKSLQSSENASNLLDKLIS